jgi:hypothetical protein
MRKFPATLLIAAFLLTSLPTSICAADFSLSAGGGGLLGYTFTRYTLEGGNVQSTQSMDRFDYAGFLFFDATYVEFSVMFKGGRSSYKENMIYSVASLADSTGTGAERSLGFSLLGKYPFTINEKCTWFPLFGLEYQVALMQRRQPEGNLVYDRSKGQLAEDRDKNENPYPLSAWNSLWINIGAGIDYNITSKLFLRSQVLFGFRLPTSYELGALEVVKNPPMNVQNPKLAGLTGSPSLKIGIGYRF